MIPLHDDNPTELAPVVTVAIMALCIGAFLWQQSLDESAQRVVYGLGVIPAVLFDIKRLSPELALVPPWVTVFSSMFLHSGWTHLLGNMLYLWIFGNNVEDARGHGRFIVFYLLCGVAAVLAQALPDPGSTIPMIGASGAISGVLGAYLLLYPHARVLVALPFGLYLHTVRLPAGWVLVFWFAIQALSSLLAREREGGVAFGAHMGGFVAGMVLAVFFRRRGVRLFNPRHR
jgi:membrane associated rhomboid family serine protease